MNREELLEHLCLHDNMDICCSENAKLSCEQCNIVMNTLLDEYDKHIIAQYEAEHGNLADMIRDIHDNVAKQMYNKAVDDFAEKLKENISESLIWRMIADCMKYKNMNDTSDKIVDYIIETSGEIAEQLKEQE